MRSSAFVTFALLTSALPAAAQEGTRPYENFTPAACAWVPRLVERIVLRDRQDTTAYNPNKDSTILLARDSTRYCSSGNTTAARGLRLLDVERVHLAVGADSAARASANAYIASLSDPEQKAWALHLVVGDMLLARPRRIEQARAALAELDKLGAKSTRASVLAHLALANADGDVWNDSATTQEASAAIAKWRILSPDDALNYASEAAEAFAMKSEIALRTVSPDAARAILDTAQRTLPSIAIGARRLIDARRRLYAVTGKKAAPIEATYWFNSADPKTIRPAPGRVSIIMEASHACGSFCRPRYRALARYAARFGSRGLDIINFTKTVGFYKDSAPASPADEARYDSTYFIGIRQMPGELGVYETKFHWLPDGRRVNEPTPLETNYPLASLVIVDKRGIIRYAAFGWDAVLEEPLAKLIDRLLSEDASGAGR